MQYNYRRRKSRPVRVGNVVIGGDNPVVIQSMTNTSTLDTAASAIQIKAIADAGAGLVRLTTQGVREAANLKAIREEAARLGCRVAVSADVHFNPKAAFEAALHADKVRINPGNFVDAARTFRTLEYTDEEYAAEIDRIRRTFVPFLSLCAERKCAVRIGVNHGSLSDRIMSRYGNSAPGMVESVMEFLRIAREVDFNDIVISVKASNTVVMVETVRLLVEKMDSEGMDYPLHLGVTEAGDAEDGRIKSALGIGALLHDGIGDTVRVSLSEPPENAVPVAALLCDIVAARSADPIQETGFRPLPGVPADYSAESRAAHPLSHLFPLATHADRALIEAFADTELFEAAAGGPNAVGNIAYMIDKAVSQGERRPVLARIAYDCADLDELRIRAAADFGALLLGGYCSGIAVECVNFPSDVLARLELDILQAARMRVTKTEYIACPGCGRTLFDLQSTLHEVKKATAHLVGLKIGVMGCIVNGPGEMADADYGYVGAGPGRVSIYRGKECVVKNIPAAEALPALLGLIGREVPDAVIK